MKTLREQAAKLAKHDSILLLQGEPGTGKKTFANYVHVLSDSRQKQFLVLNEDNFNDHDATKELFGTEVDAVVTPGHLELCKGGTIFIDDVANINAQGQKLLSRLLQRKQYNRVGGQVAQNLDARIIVATQYNLQAEVKENRFDDELYFRLNVTPIRIPSLREHLQDVPDLLRFYIDYFCAQENYPYRSFSIAAQNSLLHYTWPGNVRELRNLVQRLLILSTSDEITAEEIDQALQESNTVQKQNASVKHEDLFKLPLREARESFERGYLLHQLKEVNGNIRELAEKVGLERTHLYRKLRALGISAKDS